MEADKDILDSSLIHLLDILLVASTVAIPHALILL